MIVRGTWDWNLIKIETDSGLYGIGEAYWGWGVKDLVLNKMKAIVVGEDPLNVDKLYTKMLMQSAGAGAIGGRHRDRRERHRDRAVGPLRAHPRDARLQSAGRPFPRPRPLLSHHAGRPTNVGRSGVVARTRWTRRAPKSGAGPRSSFRATAFRPRPTPNSASPATIRTPATSRISDYRRIVKGMETVRETLGPDADFAIECHWHYDVAAT